MITIVGLGPGAVEHLSLKAWDRLQAAGTLYLRTDRHPCVPQLPKHINCVSFDDVYETVDRFADVYAIIADRIMTVARQGRDVVYAVPGDPLVGEATVTRLLKQAADAAIEVEVIHGISFIEPSLTQIGLDALDGLQILDALVVASAWHPPINPTLPALLAQVHSRQVASELKLTLMNQYPDEFPVKLIHAAGNRQTQTEVLPLYEIDRSSQIDVMTSLYMPAIDQLCSFDSFQNIIARLRSPQGCPWDRRQTHQSLRPYLIEEAYEVLEAVDSGDPDALCEELGDLLLQIVLHAQIAVDDGEFFMADVLRRLNEKMIRRHPHVWGNAEVNGDAKRVIGNWEAIKKAEKAAAGRPQESLLDDVPTGAPSLFVAHKYSRQAAKVGFDWPDAGGVEAKAKEEWDEIFAAASDEDKVKEIGDLMFVLVNWLRWLNVDDPESVMRGINAKFYRRFRYVERQAAQNKKAVSDYSLAQLEAWWRQAKGEGL